MIDFSVMVLIYNSDEARLKITLDSVLNQKGVNFELILADDASQNNSLEMAEDYLKEQGYNNYKKIEHHENVGTVRNIYDGLKVADGKYIKVIGAGDALYNNDVLHDVKSVMDKTDSTMCFGKMRGYRETGDYYEFSNVELPYDIKAFKNGDIKKIKKNILMNHGWIVGASMFYNTTRFRTLLKELVGRVKYCEDFLQAILFIRGERVEFFDSGVVYYEVNSGVSTSPNSGARARMLNDVRALRKLLMKGYPDEVLVRKGDRMFAWQLIENDRDRKLHILFGNMSYVMMLIRSKLQMKEYDISEEGLLEQKLKV